MKAISAPTDADKQKCLSWETDLKTDIEESKALEPEKASNIPADQKTAFLESYKNNMDELVGELVLLERAIEAGKWDDARGPCGPDQSVATRRAS